MLKKEEVLLISYFILVILVLVSFVVVFFYVFQKRKNKLLYENLEAERRYEQEIINSRLEIQEQTMKNVGWELHDNIGQLLSVAKMQLNMLSKTVDFPEKNSVKEIGEVIGDTLKEVRSLSKSLNSEVVGYLGLETSISNELDRFKRLDLLEIEFSVEGESVDIDLKDSIIIFRILQEFFANVIKHAEAKRLEVQLTYGTEIRIRVADNGKGFDMEQVGKNSGLFNMRSRASLVGATYSLSSVPGQGTELKLSYPFQEKRLR